LIEEAKAGPPRHLIWTLGALSMFGPLSSDMYLPGLPALTRSLHASASAGQLTLTSSVLGIALGQLLAGPVSDARGRRLPLLVGLVGFSATSVLCAVSPSIWMLIVVRLFQGLSGGAGIVIARAVVRDLFDAVTAARMFATLVMISGVAPIFAPLIGGQVLALISWRGIFWVLAAIGLLLLLLALRRVPETLAPEKRHVGGTRQTLSVFRRLLGDREFSPFALSYAFGFGAMFAYISGGSYALENVYKISAQAFSAVFAANSLGLAAVSQGSRRVVARVGPRPLFRLGLWLTSVGAVATLIVCITHGDVWLLIGSLFILVCAQGLVLPNGMAAAMSSQPDALGSASGLIGLGQFGLGALIAPIVGVGGARDALPMGIVMVVCAGVALSVNLLLVRSAAGRPRSGSR
jgi:DHA1 family bicyclomycin/chloramphenicol resistance-like MFS transporter